MEDREGGLWLGFEGGVDMGMKKGGGVRGGEMVNR